MEEEEEEEVDWGAVREFIAREVDDWDDDVAARARFKDFSGQRSDWNPRFVFWRDLILKICRRFEILFLRPRLLSNHWFIRRGVTPLCLPHVLLLMSEEGHLVRSERLLDPRTPRLSRIFTKLRNLWVTFTASDDDDDDDDDIDLFVVMPVLKEKAGQVVKVLSEEETQSLNSSVIVTMSRFEQLCGGSSASASAVLSYLSSQSQAWFVCHMNIQGVKVSLSASPVSSISSLDCDMLHLISTQETLQQQLSLIDKRCERSKESAVASLASGNKNVALRHTRTLKLANLSRDKCTTLLNRVHQVLHVIANAESTNKVSEALQIGAQAIKENSISVKQVEHTLQQLDESIDLQNQVQNALEESTPSNTFVDDEDIEEEFKKLELEIGSGKKLEAEAHAAAGETEAFDSAESLNDTFSNLKLVDSLSSTAAGRHISAKETKNFELQAA